MIENYLIRPLDLVRARLLSRTLRVSAFRELFNSRLARSLLIFTVSFVANLGLMLYFPLWTLLIVPGFLGMAHLIGSLSSFHATAAPVAWVNDPVATRKVNTTLLFSCGMFGVFRLLSYSGKFPGMAQLSSFVQTYFRLIDLLIVLGSFLCFLKIYRLPILSRAKSIMGLIGYSLLMSVWPGVFWGLFIFSHNFMAFRYWYLHAPTREERTSSIICLGFFVMIHILVLAGSLDFLIRTIPIDQGITKIFGYSFFQISWDLFPGIYDLGFSRKIVMLLCFGQGIHYLLWIKVIPECRLGLRRPVSFRQSFRLMRNEWGIGKSILGISLLVGFAIAASLLRLDWVNDLFFSIAFYHIYAEYIALALRGPSSYRLS